MLKLARDIAEMAGDMLTWTQAHPDFMKMLAGFVEFLTATALVVGPFLIALGTFGYFATIGLLGPALLAVAAALGVVGIAAAVFLNRVHTDPATTGHNVAGPAFYPGGEGRYHPWGPGMGRWHSPPHRPLETPLSDAQINQNAWESVMHTMKSLLKNLYLVRMVVKGWPLLVKLFEVTVLGIGRGLVTLQKDWDIFAGDMLYFFQKIHDFFYLISTIPGFQRFAMGQAQVGKGTLVPWASGDENPFAPRMSQPRGPGVHRYVPSVPNDGGPSTMHFHGDVHIAIQQHPGQNGRQLMREFAIELRNQSYRSPDTVLMGAS